MTSPPGAATRSSTRCRSIRAPGHTGCRFKQVMEQLTANNKQVGGQSINIGAEQYLVRGLGLVGNSTDIGGIVGRAQRRAGLRATSRP